MKMNYLTVLLVLGLSTLKPAFADDSMPLTSTNGETSNEPVTSQSFVWSAALTDMKEIHLGELALQKSDDADVKSFARRIIADHKSACKKLRALAEKKGLNYPDTNSLAWNTNYPGRTNDLGYADTNSAVPTEKPDMDSPPHLAYLLTTNLNTNFDDARGLQMAYLETLPEPEFDRAFVKHMIAGHQKAIREFENASATLQDADLRDYADDTLPVLRKHLERAQELQMKISANESGTNTLGYVSTNNTWSDSTDTNLASTATSPHHWWQFWKH